MLKRTVKLMKIALIVILSGACIAIGILAIKWHIAALTAFHIMLERGIEPSNEELERNTRHVVERLLNKWLKK